MKTQWRRSRLAAALRRLPLRWRLVGLLAGLRIVGALLPHPPLLAEIPFSTAVHDSQGRLLRLTLASDQQYRLYTPLTRISPELIAAVLRYEDRRFHAHGGVDLCALARAALSRARGGRRMGASTITMQLARRLGRLSTRTVAGKLTQMGYAWWLELRYDKEALLEAYLNLAPYGGNVEGVGAASRLRFGKGAAALDAGEALTLAVIPQNPGVRAHDEERLRRARAALAARLYPQPERRASVAATPLRSAAASLPFLAPHFVDAVLASGSGSGAVTTTLSFRLQRLVERQLGSYIARRREIGIRNAAALLVDRRTMAVRALVGSADFGDTSIAGQVNGVAAKRSPGSALKPFVYALGIEQGVIHAESLIADVPTAFAAYSPENFDGRFVGPLSAREALIRSRNIPALSVAAKLARPDLYELLRDAGIAGLLDSAHYGLGLALGNAEVTMEELVELYAALGNGGRMRPLRFRSDEPRTTGMRLLSPEASFITLTMLASNPRPDSTVADTDAGRQVAWKTGTSWGFRDAWAVGLVGPWVLAVWVGNFSGEGNPAFVGASAAAPLFFAIVDALDAAAPRRSPLFGDPPSGVERVTVCALSGGLPSAACPHHKQTWFIPGRSPIAPCTVHRALLVDDGSGRLRCGPGPGASHREVFEIWPSDLLRLFTLSGLPRRPLPAAAPGCVDPSGHGDGLHITSPLRGVTYTPLSGGAGERLALSAVVATGSRQLFWFLDDQLIGKSPGDEPLFIVPPKGTHLIRAIDDQGGSDSRELRVQAAPGVAARGETAARQGATL